MNQQLITQHPDKLAKISVDLDTRMNLLATKQDEVSFLLKDIQRLLKEQKELLNYKTSNGSVERPRFTSQVQDQTPLLCPITTLQPHPSAKRSLSTPNTPWRSS